MTFINRMRPHAISLAVMGVATMLQWSLWPYLGGAPYFMYYPALVFAILVGDGATALFVAVIATQFFADPSSELSVEWPRDVVRQTLFVAFGLILMRLGRARNEALRQERIEREKLNAVIQNANVGIGVTDMQGRVLSLNPAGLRIHGFSSESEMFRQFDEYTKNYQLLEADGRLIPFDQWPLSKACRGEYFTHYPVILRRVATGEEKHLEYSVVPIRDEHGRPVSLAFNIVDLTEGKRAQAETRSKESTLNAILDASQESIFMFAKDTRILLANKKGIERLGLPPEDVIGRRFMDFLPKEIAESRFAYLKEVIATGTEVQFEDVRNGICFLHSFSPGYAEDGSTMAVVTFSRDITERKLAEKALRESEERFRNLADSMPQLVWTAHSDGTVDYYNRRLNEFAGAKRNSDGSWAWAPMLHPDDVQRTKQAWTSAVRDKSVYTCEHRIRMVDGHYRWHLSRAFPTLDAEGHVIRWYGTATDVHALKETESALNEALRSRDEFLSIASHELKTPLTSLQLQTQITKRMISQQGEHKALAPERARAFLSQTDKQVQRLGRLIDDMLDISRISAGKLSIHREPVDLGALVVDTCEKLKPMADDARTRFDVTVQGDVRGEWDSFRLDQVITNLITNALKSGEHSPVQLRVWAEDNSACLSVTDHGRGIAHEDQSRIFQRFERAISATEVSGFGLGLFITHEIVRLHGGSVTVDSQPGHGATFTVRLPPHAHSGMMQ